MERARHAQADDLPAILRLAELGVDELVPTRGGDVWALRDARQDPQEWLPIALADPDQLVVVGTIDDVVVGFAVVRLEGLADGSRIGVLGEIYVEDQARSVGVGEAMMDAALDWCRERRCRGVESYALPGNRATKNFFESFGLTARSIVVYRALDTGDGANVDDTGATE
jgi:GNAT superfamily N-acetyltransferase